MKSLLSINQKYISYQIGLIIVIISLHFFYYTQTDIVDDRLFYFISMIIILVGLVTGSVVSLGLSLFFIFVLGSYSFWELFISDQEISRTFLIRLLFWFTIFITTSLLSGNLQGLIKDLISENKQMKSQFEELVSIDLNTGFDNRKRFFYELEEEFKRSQRYENLLSILLIQIDHLSEFRKLYGEKETNHILHKIAEQIRSTTRISDKKFRVDDNVLGVMLTHTPFANVDIVIEKIIPSMSTQLLSDNKREVTLTIKFGTAAFCKDQNDYMEMYDIAKTELENYIQ